MKTELCKLAIKYRVDKTPKIRHSYTPFYHRLFNTKRLLVKKVLEIGIGRTYKSLKMWEEYFPNAMIYGLDIRCEDKMVSNRIPILQCDQSLKKSLRQLVDKIGDNFDLIIDDGSHIPDHQIISAKILVSCLNSSGTYIIEDVLNPERVSSRLSFKTEIYTFNTTKIPDDSIICIRGCSGII